MKSYLVKRNTLLLSGIDNVKEDKTIPFENMRLQLEQNEDPKKVIIPTLSEVINISNELSQSLYAVKYIYEFDDSVFNTLPDSNMLNALYDGTGISVLDLSGKSLILKRGSSNELKEGDGISVINTSSGIFESAGFIGDSIQISKVKANLPELLNDLDDKIVVNENDIQSNKDEIQINKDDIVKNVNDISSNKSEIDSNTIKFDEKQDKISQRYKQAGLAFDNTEDSILENYRATVSNKGKIDDYFENKGDFVRVEDILSGVNIDLNRAVITKVSNTVYEVDLSSFDLSALKPGVAVEVKFNDGVNTNFIKDSYNDSSKTKQIFVVSGRDKEVNISITDSKIVIEGNMGNEDTLFLDYKAEYLEQLGNAGSSIDVDARKRISKNESDIIDLNAKKGQIDSNTSDLNTKQDSVDNSLSTSSKSIVGGINELKISSDLTKASVVNLNEKVIDGSILLQDIKQDGDSSGQTLKEALNVADKINAADYAFKLENGKVYKLETTGDGEYLFEFYSGWKKKVIALINNKYNESGSYSNVEDGSGEMKIQQKTGYLLIESHNGDGKLVIPQGGQLSSVKLTESSESIDTPIVVPVLRPVKNGSKFNLDKSELSMKDMRFIFEMSTDDMGDVILGKIVVPDPNIEYLEIVLTPSFGNTLAVVIKPKQMDA